MNILLTGASGFLGRNFILASPTQWNILAIYAHDNSFPEFVSRAGRPNVKPVRCDLSESQQIRTALKEHGKNWDCCLYLASKVDIPWSVKEPRLDLTLNVGSLLNLLSEVRADHFIYMSSGAVYDGLNGEVHPGIALNPTLPYAISKLASEHYVRFHHTRAGNIGGFTIARFFGAYGPYEAPHKIYTRLIRTFALEGKNSYAIYGDGSNLIDAMYVDDATHALQAMVNGACRNQTIDLAAGTPMPVGTLVRQIAGILGVKELQLKTEGIAHESIRFWASPTVMQDNGFTVAIPLHEGITRLREFLSAGQKEPAFSLVRGS